MKITRKLVALVLALASILGCLSVLTGCGGDNGPVIDNENTRLVLSTAELDGVFNPFYSSSGADNSIIGMTQIGMLSSDKDGKVAYGKDEACVVLDYKEQIIYEADGTTPKYTVYTFVLKNDLKFSNGSPLTMKDVLFNLYVYLDPQYYGSSTIYSTDIVGLEEYRTQSKDKNEQEKFNETFNALASERIARLVECLTTVYDNNKNTSLKENALLEQLTEEMEFLMEHDESYSTVIDDYNLAKKYFREELKKDYSYAKGTAEDIVFTDKSGKKVTLTTDTEAFFYNEGFIKWNKDDCKFEYSFGKNAGSLSEEEAINMIFNTYFPNPNKVIEVVTMWNTAFELSSYFAGLEKEKYFDSLGSEDKIANISGVVSLGHNTTTTTVTIGDKTYNVADEYNDNGSVKNSDEYEVLEITINKVDPKAIWNFGFTVAPMYYYSDQSVYKDFNYTDNFGVEFGSREFQDNVIKNPDKIGVPVGAGAYKATTRSGDSSAVTAGTFKAANVVYFERNEHFMFPVTIKYINFQVVSTNLMLDALYSGDVHFVEPSCKQENIDSIAARKKDGFTSTSVMTNGYGYIGINAEKVPSLKVRQAIMHAVNTQLAVDYYMGYSYSITRPMTKASWAYPTEKDALGQYYSFVGDDFDKIIELVEADGYSLGADGIYQKNGHKLSYVFTIAGDTTDHPAYNALKRASDILNQCGFDIEVKTDINALRKLSNGDLTVWAAAWGAGVDPDMYQVYHIDSTAGSTNNWGYRAIKKGTAEYEEELRLVKELSEIIDLARETLDSDRRAAYYAEALDIVMELAVELPTYQRSDLYAYNTNIIDASTLTPESELTPYNGPLSRIWEVSLKETK